MVVILRKHLNKDNILYDKVKVFGHINLYLGVVKEEIDLSIILIIKQ